MSPRYDRVDPAPTALPTRRPRPEPATDAAGPAKEPTDPLKPMTVAVRESLKKQLKVMCAERGITVQQAVDQALAAWIAAG